MFESKGARVATLIGFIGILASLGAAFFIRSLFSVFIIVALVIVAGWMLTIQVFYTLHLYREDRKRMEATTRLCPGCDARIYKSDDACPYCGIDLDAS